MVVKTTSANIGFNLSAMSNQTLPIHLKILEGGGFIRQVDRGIYAFLPLGVKVVNSLISLIRKAFNGINAKELILPIVQKRSIWEASGRLDKFQKNMVTAGKKMIVSPSNEELVCMNFGRNISYKQLPNIYFNIGHCYREEIRPKNGLLRSREFVLFDGYALAMDAKQHEQNFTVVKTVIDKLLTELGLNCINVFFKTLDEQKYSEEFVVKTNHIGENRILMCLVCGTMYRHPQFKECQCKGSVEVKRGIEVADLIRCGITWAERLKVGYVNREGRVDPYYLLVFGIGLSKLLALMIESNSGQFFWPKAIRPFDVAIVSSMEKTDEVAEISERLSQKNFKILWDDRDLSIGRRMKELILLGIKTRAVVGKNYEIHYAEDSSQIIKDKELFLARILESL